MPASRHKEAPSGLEPLFASAARKKPESAGAWVYVLDLDHGVKVGLTAQTPGDRLSDLQRSLGVKGAAFFRIYPMENGAAARLVEAGAHWRLRAARTVGEWFHCHPLEACEAVEAAIRLPLQHIIEQGHAA